MNQVEAKDKLLKYLEDLLVATEPSGLNFTERSLNYDIAVQEKIKELNSKFPNFFNSELARIKVDYYIKMWPKWDSLG